MSLFNSIAKLFAVEATTTDDGVLKHRTQWEAQQPPTPIHPQFMNGVAKSAPTIQIQNPIVSRMLMSVLLAGTGTHTGSRVQFLQQPLTIVHKMYTRPKQNQCFVNDRQGLLRELNPGPLGP